MKHPAAPSSEKSKVSVGRGRQKHTGKGPDSQPANTTNTKSRGAELAMPPFWKLYAVALAAALLAYLPALSGEFIFDDLGLPFTAPDAATQPVSFWLGGVRPLLMLSYWINFLISGRNPLSYHLLNLLLHTLAAAFVFRCAYTLLQRGGVTQQKLLTVSAFAAGLFLIHPLQTESVAYISGRSEVLTGALFFGAFLLFLETPPGRISYARVAGILALFGMAVLSKEHAVVLAPLLLFTGLFWDADGYRHALARFARLYAALIALGGIAALLVLRALSHAQTAGFSMAGHSWESYFMTQWRVIPVYVRLFLIPVGQCADWAFAFSRTPLDHGAIFYGLGLLAAVILLVRYRTRFPLVCYGAFVFLLLLAPTSSFVPIKDALAERRTYAPLFGLSLALAAALAHLPLRTLRRTALIIVIVATGFTFMRSRVWADDVVFWTDVVKKSSANSRGYEALGRSLSVRGRYAGAITNFQKALAIGTDPESKRSIQVSLASAYVFHRERDMARRVLADMTSSDDGARIATELGVFAAKAGNSEQAMQDFSTALRLAPGYAPAFAYRGLLEQASDQTKEAEQDFRRALAIDKSNEVAKAALAQLGY